MVHFEHRPEITRPLAVHRFAPPAVAVFFVADRRVAVLTGRVAALEDARCFGESDALAVGVLGWRVCVICNMIQLFKKKCCSKCDVGFYV